MRTRYSRFHPQYQIVEISELPSVMSDVLTFLQPSDQPEPCKEFDCRVLDGAVVVHSLPINSVSIFNQYADEVFLPHILHQASQSGRTNIVWDAYRPESLKEATREKRGKGVRRKVSAQTKTTQK